MDTIQTGILGIVQGITELLPISSSGHLILLSNLVFSRPISTLLLTSLHLGTTLAILFAYRNFFFKDLFNKVKLRTLSYIAIATLPAAILGVLFGSAIEQKLHGNYVVVSMLILIGILMIIFEKSELFKRPKINNWNEIPLWKAVVIGFGQALALIPGTSRSGATTLTAMLLGVEKFKAIEYSFVLGAPILLGSFLYSMYKTPNSFDLFFTAPVLIGVLLSAVAGFVAIEILKRLSKANFLTFFGIYRILLGGSILLALL